MRVLGLVTARGGSKGFPRKNLAPLAGRPLVAWAHRTLDLLRGSRPALQLWLSTDDPEIASAWPARDRPGTLRPASLARDETSSLAVVEYEIERCRASGRPVDAVLLLQPTSPLLTADDLESMWAAIESGAESVIAAAPLDHPLRWSLHLDRDGVVSPAAEWSDGARQAEAPAYRPAGAYLTTVGFLAQHRAFTVPGRTRAVIVPADRGVDIDTPSDLDRAEAALRRRGRGAVLNLAGHAIGDGAPAFLIAEAGVNHNGDADLALRLIDAAADAGADAVKFQTFRPESLVTGTASMAAYQRSNLGVEATQAEILRGLCLADEQFAVLRDHAAARGLVFLSSPFDLESARLLRDLGVPALKLGSGELTNHPFLAEVASLGLPLILSTGMATLDECEEAERVLRGAGAPSVCWLHCVSSYPAPAASMNLRAMESLRSALEGPVGLSDHTMGWAIALAGAALGARVIEKHLTLSRDLPGPDHAASLEPHEFAEMVTQIRRVESALGDGVKRPAACEADTIRAARRSIVVTRDLPAGHVLRREDLTTKRPATGLAPSMLERVVGRRLGRAVACDHTLVAEDLAENADLGVRARAG
jgi:N-acetylneuraminate synthase/N,N'-diacetyllegionaminate synthase